MNVTANEYATDIERNQANSAQHKLELISDFIENDKLEIVVDIGCGSGKLTSLINAGLVCDKFIGIDIDNDMIDYANANNRNNKNIEFLTQNIDCEWTEMRPELKALEGKVSLVFTNYALHWIKVKENTVKNIYRLLANGGKLFAIMFVVPDPMKHYTSLKDDSIPDFLKIAPREQQRSDWLNVLNNKEFTAENSGFFPFCHTYTEDVFENIVQKLFLFSVYVELTDETERNEFLSKYREVIARGHKNVATNSYVNEQTGQKMVDLLGHHFITRAVKSNCKPSH